MNTGALINGTRLLENWTELWTPSSESEQVVENDAPFSIYVFKIGPSCGKNPQRNRVGRPTKSKCCHPFKQITMLCTFHRAKS